MTGTRLVRIGSSVSSEKKNITVKQINQRMTKNFNKTCATSEDADQTAHPRSLIRVFADHKCLLQPPCCPKRDKMRTFAITGGGYTGWLSLCWSHRSYCRFCHALAQTVAKLQWNKVGFHGNIMPEQKKTISCTTMDPTTDINSHAPTFWNRRKELSFSLKSGSVHIL